MTSSLKALPSVANTSVPEFQFPVNQDIDTIVLHTLATCSSFSGEDRLLQNALNIQFFVNSGTRRRGDSVEPLIVWEPEWHTVVEHLWTMGELWGDSDVDLLSHYLLEYERKMRSWQRAKHGIIVSQLLGDSFRKYERSLRRHLKKCATQLPEGKTDFDTRFARSEIAEIAFCVIRLTWHSLRCSRAEEVPWLVLSASLLLQGYSVIDIIKRGEREHLLAY